MYNIEYIPNEPEEMWQELDNLYDSDEEEDYQDYWYDSSLLPVEEEPYIDEDSDDYPVDKNGYKLPYYVKGKLTSKDVGKSKEPLPLELLKYKKGSKDFKFDTNRGILQHELVPNCKDCSNISVFGTDMGGNSPSDREYYDNYLDEESSDNPLYDTVEDDPNYHPVEKVKYYPIKYVGNGFVIYVRTWLDTTRGTNDIITNKYNNLKFLLQDNIKNIYIDDNTSFYDLTKSYTKLVDRIHLLKCRNYAKDNQLNIVVSQIQDICWNKKDLELAYTSFLNRGVEVYVLEKQSKKLDSGKFLYKLINISEFLDEDNPHFEYFDKLEKRLYGKLAISMIEGTFKGDEANVRIKKTKNEIVEEAIDKKKESIYLIDKPKYGKKWLSRFKTYIETGTDIWLNICLGLPEEGDNLDIEGKDYQEVYGVSVASLVRAFEESNLYPIWNPKTKYTDSMITNIKRECRHVKDLWSKEGLVQDIVPNSKHILEVPKERLKEFSKDLSSGKYDLPERGLIFNDMYPDLVSKK